MPPNSAGSELIAKDEFRGNSELYPQICPHLSSLPAGARFLLKFANHGTIWFEARRDRKIGNFGVWKLLIFNNHARGMSVANSPESSTQHYRITQKSRNHLASAQDGLATEALSC